MGELVAWPGPLSPAQSLAFIPPSHRAAARRKRSRESRVCVALKGSPSCRSPRRHALPLHHAVPPPPSPPLPMSPTRRGGGAEAARPAPDMNHKPKVAVPLKTRSETLQLCQNLVIFASTHERWIAATCRPVGASQRAKSSRRVNLQAPLTPTLIQSDCAVSIQMIY